MIVEFHSNLASTRDIDGTPEARFLVPDDIPALLALEHEKWNGHQAASAAVLAERIAARPGLCVGAFRRETGALLASLFMQPVAPDFWRHSASWQDCTSRPAPDATASLFGISLSSREPAAVDALMAFFWPYALKGGWREIFLGSPIPGLRDWLIRHPGVHHRVADYVHMRRGGLPLDPQLRYYHARGFRQIVCVQPGYFPHAPSLDHGVILRGTVPLSLLYPMWRALPLAHVQRVTRRCARLL